jgi:hypothetical protein
LDGERRWPALDRCAEDAFLGTEIWHARPAKGEALVQSTSVRNVLAELGGQDRQLSEARGADIVVAQGLILSRSGSANNR